MKKSKEHQRNLSKTNNIDDIVNFSLVSHVQFEPSFYEVAMKHMVCPEEINAKIDIIERNEASELVYLCRGKDVI